MTCFLCRANLALGGDNWRFVYVALPRTFQPAQEMLLCPDCRRTCAVNGQLYVPMPAMELMSDPEPKSRSGWLR